MNALSPFLSMNRSCDETLLWLSQCLPRAGLRMLQTFDLHDARFAVTDCACPHHGTDQCDCQMIVLLIYGQADEPAALILHGNDGQTWLSLVNTPLQHADPSLQSSIEQALQITPSE
jgi:hypothetical protein